MNKKNILLPLLLIILVPLVNARCEDINEILKERWQWSSGSGFFKVYSYPLSTKLIYDYNKERGDEYLIYNGKKD